jgi:glycerol uptake facilitator-like aquaporin
MHTFGYTLAYQDVTSTDSENNIANMWIYILAPFVGGICAGFWQNFNVRAMEAYKTADRQTI